MPIIQNEFCLVSPVLLLHNKDSDDNYKTINLRDTTHFDSEDDYCTGCLNISLCSQQEQSYSGLYLPGRSNSTYFWNNNNNNNSIKNLRQTFTNNIFLCLHVWINPILIYVALRQRDEFFFVFPQATEPRKIFNVLKLVYLP